MFRNHHHLMRRKRSLIVTFEQTTVAFIAMGLPLLRNSFYTSVNAVAIRHQKYYMKNKLHKDSFTSDYIQQLWYQRSDPSATSVSRGVQVSSRTTMNCTHLRCSGMLFMWLPHILPFRVQQLVPKESASRDIFLWEKYDFEKLRTCRIVQRRSVIAFHQLSRKKERLQLNKGNLRHEVRLS